ASREQASQSIAAYIHGFYNPARLHSALGYHSPNNYARQLRAAPETASWRPFSGGQINPRHGWRG
ncbi:IS3 family transposase, partial [Stenotrophomonas maltophilia]|uniref:IS3 family transposase n=1 Tax=Stenotrophomonas maltophilia TaxID=40324 RepID=UPI0013DD07EC